MNLKYSYKELTPEQKERLAKFADALFTCTEIEKKLQNKSNKELARLLVDHVWADTILFSFEDALIGVIVDRLTGEEQ